MNGLPRHLLGGRPSGRAPTRPPDETPDHATPGQALTDEERGALRVAVDRDECGPGEYNDTRHLFAAVERILAARTTAPGTEASDAPSEEPTAAGQILREIAATGNEVMEPWRFIPCGREHEADRVCILPDGHAKLRGGHHPDCPGLYFARVDRCRCAYLFTLDADSLDPRIRGRKGGPL